MEKPDCFGIWWEAVPGPAGDNCRTCDIKDDCLAKFATKTLPAAQVLWSGVGDPLAFLARHLEVSEQAVLLAMAHQKCSKPSKQTPAKIDKPKTKVNSRENKAKKKKRKGKKGRKKWGEHTHEIRWNQERERNPLIAQLTPGTKLKSKYKGKTVTAIVKKGGYDHRGQTFPTLSTLTMHIVGGSRNATRFWKLEKKD
jgi:hypothetical protein